MPETPEAHPDRKNPTREDIERASDVGLTSLKQEVELKARRLAYVSCIIERGFDPTLVQLEVSATAVSMTIPTEGGSFKVWTADGYSWYLNGIEYRPTSYDPSAWFDAKGLGTLELVLRHVRNIDSTFAQIKNGDLKVDPDKESPFYISGRTIKLSLSEAVLEELHSGHPSMTKEYRAVLANSDADAQKFADSLNAHYKKLYGTKK